MADKIWVTPFMRPPHSVYLRERPMATTRHSPIHDTCQGVAPPRWTRQPFDSQRAAVDGECAETLKHDAVAALIREILSAGRRVLLIDGNRAYRVAAVPLLNVHSSLVGSSHKLTAPSRP